MAEAFEDGGDEHGEALADGARVAGEVDDEAFAADAGGGSGEDGGGDFFETPQAHGFAEAGEFFFNDGAGGFGGVVACGGSGAAGGDDERAILAVAKFDECGGNFFGVVGKDA